MTRTAKSNQGERGCDRHVHEVPMRRCIGNHKAHALLTKPAKEPLPRRRLEPRRVTKLHRERHLGREGLDEPRQRAFPGKVRRGRELQKARSELRAKGPCRIHESRKRRRRKRSFVRERPRDFGAEPKARRNGFAPLLNKRRRDRMVKRRIDLDGLEQLPEGAKVIARRRATRIERSDPIAAVPHRKSKPHVGIGLPSAREHAARDRIVVGKRHIKIRDIVDVAKVHGTAP